MNWHFKPDEKSACPEGFRNLRPDRPCRPAAWLCGAIPADVSAERPDAARNSGSYKIDPDFLAAPGFATDLESWLEQQRPYDGPALPQPQNMIYTSGTTGHPKGVRRNAPTPEQTIASERLRALIYGLKPGARALLPGPLYHSAPNSFGLRSGRLGGALVLMPRFDPQEFLRLIQDQKIDTIFMVPTMFIRLLKLPEQVRKKYDTSSLRHIVHAAAPCPAEAKRAMIEWWGPVIREYYGSTESSALTFANSDDALRKPGTVGKIIDGVELRFVGENGDSLPQGGIGEIYSRVADNPDFTYHNKPEKRAEIERDGFITSGDVGYIDEEGYVFICDRKRDMVISGGVNIYPAEIEAALHTVPGVRLRGVRIPTTNRRGADGRGGTASGGDARRGVIRAQLKASLAGYGAKHRNPCQSAARIPYESSSGACAIPIERAAEDLDFVATCPGQASGSAQRHPMTTPRAPD